MDTELKKIYNEKLTRYYNGCQYVKEHYKEADKWIPVIVDILEEINLILEEIEEKSEEEILKGFKI